MTPEQKRYDLAKALAVAMLSSANTFNDKDGKTIPVKEQVLMAIYLADAMLKKLEGDNGKA